MDVGAGSKSRGLRQAFDACAFVPEDAELLATLNKVGISRRSALLHTAAVAINELSCLAHEWKPQVPVMPDNSNANDLASLEIAATDSHENRYDRDPSQKSAEKEEPTIQCQNGVCMVSWKPKKSAAA
jgi:hypothetical protein